MAIKVKHEGSAASRIAAAQQGGAAKRAMEAAALIKPTPIQTLAPAHASAPGIGGVHAQLISAPGGGAHAPLIGGGGGIGAHARMGGGGGRGGGAGSRVSTAGGGGGDLDYKVTGTSIFDRPDDESQWDPTNGGRWVRKWLPGEKEAEALGRVGSVKNAQEMEMLGFKHKNARDLAEQSSLLATEKDIALAKLRARIFNPEVTAETKSPFPTDLVSQMNAAKEKAKSPNSEIQSTEAEPAPDEQAPDGIQSLFDKIVSQSGGSSNDVAMRLAGVYANGGSIFGLQQEGGTAGTGGGIGPLNNQPENEYEQYLGGLMNMLLPNN